jgi:hypothetical protein
MASAIHGQPYTTPEVSQFPLGTRLTIAVKSCQSLKMRWAMKISHRVTLASTAMVVGFMLLPMHSFAQLSGEYVKQRAESRMSNAELKELVASLFKQPSDLAAAKRLVTSFGGGRGYRGFSNGKGFTNNPIEDMYVSESGTLSFTYWRDSKRAGSAVGAAYWLGSYLVYAGDWYQTPKSHSWSLPIPKLGSVPFGQFQDAIQNGDHGGFVYVWSVSANGLTFVAGQGMDYGDGGTNPNWIGDSAAFYWREPQVNTPKASTSSGPSEKRTPGAIDKR